MRAMTGLRARAGIAAAVVAVLALGGCGSETEAPSSSGPSSTEEGFDPASATLTEDPFCDRVDTAVVGEVLGMPSEKVRTQVDRKVGEEFEGMDEEAGPSTSVANLCVFGSSTSQFTVSVQPDAGATDVQETVDELASLAGKGSSEQCTSEDADAFGDPAASFTCETGGALNRVRVVVTGLVGGSKFYCAAAMNTGAGPEFPAAAVDACRTTLEELATTA